MNRIIYLLLALNVFVTELAAQEELPKRAPQLVDRSGVQGGLIVHAGTTDVAWTAQLRVSDRYLVQGLQRDDNSIQRSSQWLLENDKIGSVTVCPWSGRMLPYADNLVNLLIVEDASELSASEVSRVLVPDGIAYVRSGGRWRTVRKRRPEGIDQWTHFLHGPDNNAVAEDTEVAPPHHLQWSAEPRWGRSHDQLGGVSAVVSAAGRIFSIVDEGNVASVQDPAKWMLVARDAFNGVLLWKRPIANWEDHLRPFRSGPAALPRRLVASDERLFVTLGYGEPVTALDGATGEILQTYPETKHAQEIVYASGKLYVIVGEQPRRQARHHAPELPEWLGPYPQYVHLFPPKHIVCLSAMTGEVLWKRQDAETTHVLPLTMATDQQRVYFQNEKSLVAVDSGSGKTVWNADRPISLHRYAWSAPTVVVKDGVVLSGDRTSEEVMPLDTEFDETGPDRPKYLVSAGHELFGGEIVAFSAESGQRLWSVPCHESFNAPVDVFVARGQVWSGQVAWTPQPGIAQVYDLRTGEVVAKRPPDSDFGRFGHHRCYRAKATVNYVLHSRRGIEFVDMGSDQLLVDRWLRGTCQYGVLPCNGMIYTPPHACACYVTHQLNSFNALVAKRAESVSDDSPRLVRGSAWERAGELRPSGGVPGINHSRAGDWPMYRRDRARSGATRSEISSNLASGWQVTLGDQLSQPIVAEGMVFVARPQSHSVHAVNARDGSRSWHFCAGGPVDSPPTYSHGFLFFGAADGWVYCLCANDGKLVWRYRAAPESRQIVSYGHVESIWPTQGSLLVLERPGDTSVVLGVAGRSTYLDGGMVLFGLNAATGGLLFERRLHCPSPESVAKTTPLDPSVFRVNVLPDILSTDGKYLFMRNQAFDLEGKPISRKIQHLFSSAGFLDDSWWHRTYWQYGSDMSSGYGGWITAGNRRISGRLLVRSDDQLFGFGRKGYEKSGSHARAGARYHLFAAKIPPPPIPEKARKRSGPQEPSRVAYDWSVQIPFYGRAMMLSGNHLFVAGPERITDLKPSTDEGESWLWVFDATDGSRLASYKLPAAPVFDSLATDERSVYLTTVDGCVVCYRAQK